VGEKVSIGDCKCREEVQEQQVSPANLHHLLFVAQWVSLFPRPYIKKHPDDDSRNERTKERKNERT
jgi:hypothetical protein